MTECAIHFFLGHSDALQKHLVKGHYASDPTSLEQASMAAGHTWQGTLQVLLSYVDECYSPLVAKLRHAFTDQRGWANSTMPWRWEGEGAGEGCMHVWYHLNPEQGDSGRAIQAMVTTLDGAGDVARERLLGEELVTTLHLAVHLALRPQQLPLARVDDAMLHRAFPAFPPHT